MTAPASHVAIYIDYDNVVISRASQAKETGAAATVAIDALLDFATRYGRLTISRAYADWSVRTNADYKDTLVSCGSSRPSRSATTLLGASVRSSVATRARSR